MDFDFKKIEEVKDKEFKRLSQEKIKGGDEKGNLLIEGRNFNLMGADYFMAGFLELLSRWAGPAAGGILYNAGVDIGRSYFKLNQKNQGENETLGEEEVIGKCLGLLKLCGYSDIKFFRKNGIKVKSSPTAVAYREKFYDKEKRKTCYYLSGILAGILSKAAKKNLKVVELKCLAEGYFDCEFRILEEL